MLDVKHLTKRPHQNHRFRVSAYVFGFSCRKRHETAHLAFYDALLTLFSFQGTVTSFFAAACLTAEYYNSIFICLCQYYYVLI